MQPGIFKLQTDCHLHEVLGDYLAVHCDEWLCHAAENYISEDPGDDQKSFDLLGELKVHLPSQYAEPALLPPLSFRHLHINHKMN